MPLGFGRERLIGEISARSPTPNMSQPSFRNALLNLLPARDRDVFRPAWDRVALTPGTSVIEPLSPISHVLFVESGVLSVMADRDGREALEVAMIGREGMAGVFLALGCPDVPFRVSVQSAGEVIRMASDHFVDACQASPMLRGLALRYAQVLTTQVAETARCNGRLTVEARLARWLLMAHDRAEGDELVVTHETLAVSLGVRRPGVTVAIHILEGEHLIRATRGRVEIRDRSGLKDAAKGSYGLPEAEFSRLLRSSAFTRSSDAEGGVTAFGRHLRTSPSLGLTSHPQTGSP